MKQKPYYNFTTDSLMYINDPNRIPSKFLDERNNIETIDLVPGLESYMNYLDILNSKRNKWVDNGYLDLGMIPVFMAPSFLQSVLVREVLPIVSEKGIKAIPMPAVSLLTKNSNMRGEKDYWAFRKDIADIVGKSPREVRTRDIFRLIEEGL